MPVVNRATLRRVVAVLERTRPNVEAFDFGPAYENAVKEHAEVLRLLRSALRDKQHGEQKPARPSRVS